MALGFKKLTFPPIQALTLNVPDGALIGIIGEDGAGKSALLRLAAGAQRPISGSVTGGKTRRLIGPGDPLDFSTVDVLLLDRILSPHDALVSAKASVGLERLRRGGCTILCVTHDEKWLESQADEVWWMHEGKIHQRGDASIVLPLYRRHVSDQLRIWGESAASPMATDNRRGNGKAEIVRIETLGTQGRPTGIWRSGEAVEVRVILRFNQAVSQPVVGLLIRTRIGLDVYGTNTELEGLRFGPCSAGQTVTINFSFHCDLCPGDYTLTVASHDPDGTRHDWLDEAVAMTVVDDRYAAGVANLRARVTLG